MDFDLTKVVLLSRNLYAVDQTVADLYTEASNKNLPCGYAWTTIKTGATGWELQDVSSEGKIGTKEGQALTGDIKSRVQSFATTHPQLVLDVLIDPFFSKPQQDKKLNEWRSDHENGVELDSSKRTLEGLVYDSAEILEEIRIRRRNALRIIAKDKFAGAVEVFIGTKQFEKACYAIKIFREGGRSVLADLCARFGKTIWAGLVADFSRKDITVVATYVKTVHTSFINDLGDKKQFVEIFDFVNCEDKNWKEQIELSLKEGKRVILFLSLCPGSNRQDRIDYIGSVPYSRLWIVDEADFGAHTKNQVDALRQGVKEEDYLLLMTGTNPDVAIRQWTNFRKFKEISCTYTELLIQKEKTRLEIENV